MEVSVQLDNFLENVCDDSRLSNLKKVSDLYRKLVKAKKYTRFTLVFLLMKLALILLIVTPAIASIL